VVREDADQKLCCLHAAEVDEGELALADVGLLPLSLFDGRDERGWLL
jgi:hypothetical protein